MKKILINFLLSICIPLLAESSKEIVTLDLLIECSQNNLNNLSYLKEKILQYQAEQTHYMADQNNNEALYNMIKLADIILDNIKTYQLTPSFDPAFLSELTIISKPASKLGIPKP